MNLREESGDFADMVDDAVKLVCGAFETVVCYFCIFILLIFLYVLSVFFL